MFTHKIPRISNTMSLAGERLHTPFPQSTPPGNPSHLDTPNSRSGRGVAIPNSQLLGCIQARQHPYPALRPYEQSLAVQTLILVRKPPRERLAASRSSVEHDEPPALLVSPSFMVHQLFVAQQYCSMVISVAICRRTMICLETRAA